MGCKLSSNRPGPAGCRVWDRSRFMAQAERLGSRFKTYVDPSTQSRSSCRQFCLNTRTDFGSESDANSSLLTDESKLTPSEFGDGNKTQTEGGARAPRSPSTTSTVRTNESIAEAMPMTRKPVRRTNNARMFPKSTPAPALVFPSQEPVPETYSELGSAILKAIDEGVQKAGFEFPESVVAQCEEFVPANDIEEPERPEAKTVSEELTRSKTVVKGNGSRMPGAVRAKTAVKSKRMIPRVATLGMAKAKAKAKLLKSAKLFKSKKNARKALTGARTPLPRVARVKKVRRLPGDNSLPRHTRGKITVIRSKTSPSFRKALPRVATLIKSKSRFLSNGRKKIWITPKVKSKAKVIGATVMAAKSAKAKTMKSKKVRKVAEADKPVSMATIALIKGKMRKRRRRRKKRKIIDRVMHNFYTKAEMPKGVEAPSWTKVFRNSIGGVAFEL